MLYILLLLLTTTYVSGYDVRSAADQSASLLAQHTHILPCVMPSAHRAATGSFQTLQNEITQIGVALESELDAPVHILAHRMLSWYADLTPRRIIQWHRHTAQERHAELMRLQKRVADLLEGSNSPASRACLEHMYTANSTLLSWLSPEMFPKLPFRSRGLIAKSSDPLIPSHALAKIGMIACIVTVGTLTFLTLFKDEEQKKETMSVLQEELDKIEQKRREPVDRDRLIGIGLLTIEWLRQHPEYASDHTLSSDHIRALMAQHTTPENIALAATEMGLKDALASLGAHLEHAVREGAEIKIHQHLHYLATWATMSGLGHCGDDAYDRTQADFTHAISSLLTLPRDATPSAELAAHIATIQSGDVPSLDSQQELLLWLIKTTNLSVYHPVASSEPPASVQAVESAAYAKYQRLKASRDTRFRDTMFARYKHLPSLVAYASTSPPRIDFIRDVITTQTDMTPEEFDRQKQDLREAECRAYHQAVRLAHADTLPGLSGDSDIAARLAVYQNMYQPRDIVSIPADIRMLHSKKVLTPLERKELLGWWVANASAPETRQLRPHRAPRSLAPSAAWKQSPAYIPHELQTTREPGGPVLPTATIPPPPSSQRPVSPAAAAGATPMTRSPASEAAPHQSKAPYPQPKKEAPLSTPKKPPQTSMLTHHALAAAALTEPDSPGGSPMSPPVHGWTGSTDSRK